MKKNNKGFMLVEVIVTSTVIVAAMIGLYASFNKLYVNYDSKSKYYNIDAVYATKVIFSSMLNEKKINSTINKIFQDSQYGYFINSKECNSEFFETNSTCDSVKELYDVENMIIVEYDKEVLLNFKNESLNETFKEYIDYVINYYDVTTNEEYSYLLLTEIYDGSDYYYANLRVR